MKVRTCSARITGCRRAVYGHFRFTMASDNEYQRSSTAKEQEEPEIDAEQDKECQQLDEEIGLIENAFCN